jgi:hypothetical protein
MRADGFAEDADGNIAVCMTTRTGINADGNAFFTYVTTYLSPEVTVEWEDTEGNFALFEVNVANGLLSNGWARGLTAKEVDAVNANHEAPEPAKDPAPAKPVETPSTPATPPAAPTPPAKAKQAASNAKSGSTAKK